MFDLTDRVVLVTGGNDGIGWGIARGVAQAGARVCLWGRRREKNEEAAAALRGLGGEADFVTCDVSDEDSVIHATTATVERFGRIDACFANAGHGQLLPFMKMSAQQFNDLLATNLTGAMVTLREVARHMIDRGGSGKLIAISSIGEIYGMPGQAHYSASKGGLSALVRSLAVELARHDIQVNSIQPGFIETAATKPLVQWKKMQETILHRTPARRWGQPEDFAGIAVYLASELSRFHTGDTIRVDGGYSIF